MKSIHYDWVTRVLDVRYNDENDTFYIYVYPKSVYTRCRRQRWALTIPTEFPSGSRYYLGCLPYIYTQSERGVVSPYGTAYDRTVKAIKMCLLGREETLITRTQRASYSSFACGTKVKADRWRGCLFECRCKYIELAFSIKVFAKLRFSFRVVLDTVSFPQERQHCEQCGLRGSKRSERVNFDVFLSCT